MNGKILLLIFCLASLSMFAQDNTHNLMPVPQSLKANDSKYRVNRSFTIAVTGNPDERMYKEASRALRRLDNRTGLFFTQGNIGTNDTNLSASLIIDVNRPRR
jgi:hexosaminidase